MQLTTEQRLSCSFRAMGTEIMLALWPHSGREATARRALARETIVLRRAEQRLSRFLPNSEIAVLNHAGGGAVRVSGLTFAAVSAALAAAEATGGLFDPTVHDALIAAGYDRSFEQLGASRDPLTLSPPKGEPLTGPLTTALQAASRPFLGARAARPPRQTGSRRRALRSTCAFGGCEAQTSEALSSLTLSLSKGDDRCRPASEPSGQRWRGVRLNSKARTVSLPAGVKLDLGGIAKGWLADQAASRLGRYGAALADLGGDIAMRGLPPNEPAWRIGLLADDGGPNLLGQIVLAGGGVATSGVSRRRWQTSAGWQHHLIDPRTGRPALTDLRSVSVVGPSATVAEAAAKAVLLLGAEAGREALARTPALGAVLVLANGAIQTAGCVAWQPAARAGDMGGHAS